MRKYVAAIAAVAAMVVLAVPATGAAATGVSKAQFNSLKAKVTQLQSQLTQAESDIGNLAFLAIYNECDDAIQWDWIQSLTSILGYDPGPRYDDTGTCAALGIDRSRTAARSTAGAGTVVPTFVPSSAQHEAAMRGIIARVAG